MQVRSSSSALSPLSSCHCYPRITITAVTITAEGQCTVTTTTLIRRVPVEELLPLPMVGMGRRQRRRDSGMVEGGGRKPTRQIDDDSVG